MCFRFTILTFSALKRKRRNSLL